MPTPSSSLNRHGWYTPGQNVHTPEMRAGGRPGFRTQVMSAFYCAINSVGYCCAVWFIARMLSGLSLVLSLVLFYAVISSCPLSLDIGDDTLPRHEVV